MRVKKAEEKAGVKVEQENVPQYATLLRPASVVSIRNMTV